MFCVNVIDNPFASLNGNEKSRQRWSAKPPLPVFLSIHATYFNLELLLFPASTVAAFICLEARRIAFHFGSVQQTDNQLLPANHCYFLYQGEV